MKVYIATYQIHADPMLGNKPVTRQEQIVARTFVQAASEANDRRLNEETISVSETIAPTVMAK